jgi:hypothetical protein
MVKNWFPPEARGSNPLRLFRLTSLRLLRLPRRRLYSLRLLPSLRRKVRLPAVK